MSETPNEAEDVAQLRVPKHAALHTFNAHEREAVAAVQAGEYEVAAAHAETLFLYAGQLPAWWDEYTRVGDSMAEAGGVEALEENATRAAFRRLAKWARATGHPVAEWFDDAQRSGELAPWGDLTYSEKTQFAELLRSKGINLDDVEAAERFYGDPEAVEEALDS